MKTHLLPSVLALLCATSAMAAEYYVVVPVKGRTAAAPEQDIQVSLNAYTLPGALEGTAYSFDLKPLLTVTGDNAYNGSGVTWSVVSSSLPAGLHLTSDGFIGGTPTASGSGDITVRASYKTKSGEQTYQVVSAALTVSLASATLPAGTVGTAYSYDFKPLASSNDPAFSGAQASFSATGLPAGLNLASNGVVSGTPTEVTNRFFDVSATYKNKTASASFSLNVGEPYSLKLVSGGPPGSTDISDASEANTVIKRYGNTAYSSAVTFNGQNPIYFDGSGDYLVADGAVSSLTSVSSKWTVSMDVYQTAVGSGPVLFALTTKANGTNVVLLGPNTLVVNTTTYTFPSTISPIGSWSKVELSFNGTTFNVFKDGVQVYSVNAKPGIAPSNCNFGIAVDFDSANAGAPGNYWSGYIGSYKFSPGYAK